MREFLTKSIGFALTLLCWYAAILSPKTLLWNVISFGLLPLTQYPITVIGRTVLDAEPVPRRARWASIFVHYGIDDRARVLPVSSDSEIRFGESYIQYRESTPFLWPQRSSRNRQSARHLGIEEVEQMSV